MNSTKKKKIDSGCRYRITSKSKIIWKLICMWAKLQTSRKQSIVFACEFAHKLFGDGDLIAGVMRSQNENALDALREFTSDICSVEFNSSLDNIPDNIEVWFYKDQDVNLYNWLCKQTSVTASVSFAIYFFIRAFGIVDSLVVILDMALRNLNINDMLYIKISDVVDGGDH